MEKFNTFARRFAAFGLLTIIRGFAATSTIAGTPVRFKQVQNLIVVSVTVNRAGPFDFILDTGASSTVIDLDLAKRLALSPIESLSVLTIAGSKTVACYRLDTLALGPKSVRDLTVLCTELRDIHGISPKIRGVLGQNFLSGFDYILNHRDRRSNSRRTASSRTRYRARVLRSSGTGAGSSSSRSLRHRRNRLKARDGFRRFKGRGLQSRFAKLRP